MIKKIISILQQQGVIYLIKMVLTRFYMRKAKSYDLVKKVVSYGNGLEIGGLSPIFQKKNILPIYPHINRLDNCNFSYHTVWEEDLNKGLTYTYDEKREAGRQFILEATDLSEIKSESYDFLLSSHVLEHTANPIKALHEWIRVVKTKGHLILLIPHKDGTFDHNRPTTSLEHLIQDYENNTTEKDLTHLDEILKLHDLSMDKAAGTYVEFHDRSKKNYENRCLHHHVFNVKLVVQLIDHMKLKIKTVESISPMHILIIAEKPQKDTTPNNIKCFDYVSLNEFNDPFAWDQK